MELKQGYKQTELGVVPEDWTICRFDEVMTGFSSGQTPSRAIKDYYKGTIPWITSGELNYNVITDTKEKITEAAVNNTGLKIIPEGTFLFAITGLEAEGTRGSCAITGIKAATNQSCMALYPKKGKLITSYLYHFYVRYGNELAFKYCQGTKQQSFTGGIAKTLPIILPPTIEEQAAIAEALNDIDALIDSLEKLIEKKNKVKKGIERFVFTPQKSWKEKQLAEISDVNMGQSPLSQYYNSEGNGLALIQGNADLKNRRQVVRYWTTETTKQCESGDILMTVRAPVGTIGMAIEKSCIGRGVCSFKNLKVDRLFFYYLLIYNESKWKLFEQGSTFTSANSSQIEQFAVSVPETYDEQAAIADILYDMDSELSSLEAKLEKYKQIKQGMMQQLLTGKIRLVTPLSTGKPIRKQSKIMEVVK